jgi:dihydrofolate reductase
MIQIEGHGNEGVMTARLTSIVAIDRNGAIGCRNALPWNLKSDMAFFRTSTMGHSVIMGRKTYESIGKPLPGRKNIVLSHNGLLFDSTPNCQLGLSVSECLARAQLNRSREIFVIGGAATYTEFAPLVDRYLVTMVDHIVPDADAFLSSEILGEIGSWAAEEVDRVEASQGVDDFGFEIKELVAPDAEERSAIRRKLAVSCLIKNQKAAVTRSRLGGISQFSLQEAFAF